MLDKFPQTNLDKIILYMKTKKLTLTNLTDLEKKIILWCLYIVTRSIIVSTVATLILVRFSFASWEASCGDHSWKYKQEVI